MIIVFGGAFNPPTKAHLAIVNGLIETYQPTKTVIVPVGNHYEKSALASFSDRVNMLKLLIPYIKGPVEISMIEEQPPYLGTYYALRQIKKECKQESIYFVIGTDHVNHLKDWIKADKLLKEFKFIIVRRRNFYCDFRFLKEVKCEFLVYDFDSDIASTKIRLAKEKFKDDMVPEVYNYINEHNLYNNNNNK